jgi:hypothetical protein
LKESMHFLQLLPFFDKYYFIMHANLDFEWMFMILPNHLCDSIVIIYVFIYYIVSLVSLQWESS